MVIVLFPPIFCLVSFLLQRRSASGYETERVNKVVCFLGETVFFFVADTYRPFDSLWLRRCEEPEAYQSTDDVQTTTSTWMELVNGAAPKSIQRRQ